MTDEQMAEIGKRIREARDAHGLSRPALADILELHPTSIANYEKGRVPWKDLPRIAEALNRDVRWLIYGESYQDPLDRIDERLARIEEVLSVPPGATEPSLGERLVALSRSSAGEPERVPAPPAKGRGRGEGPKRHRGETVG
jgi:transcriptional regulator with XRE-family HTH domain